MSCCKDKMEPVETDSCCTPRETSQQAALSMRKTGCGCAPVVEDKQSRRLVGVVTERDMCHRVAADDRGPRKSQPGDWRVPRPPAAAWMNPREDVRRKSTHTRRRVCLLWTRLRCHEQLALTNWET